MNKGKLDRFITKYNLGGTCESVTFRSDGTTLSVGGISDDKNLVLQISASGLNFPTGEFNIYDTKRLRSVLNVLEEDIQIAPISANDKTTGLRISDGKVKATYVLADSITIPKVPTVKIPPMELSIVIDQEFINRFVKAVAAVEAKTFAVQSNGDNVASVIVGHSNLNTNRVEISATTTQATEFELMHFDAEQFKQILLANKDLTNGVFNVTSKRLANITFDVPDFTISYCLVPLKI